MKIIKAITAWNTRRKDRNILHAMSDRELWDIGINRCDIDRLV